MALAARKINQETVVDPKTEYTRVWSFRTQEQMDLWINEMQGQISDGMWENSRGTEWLWKGNDIYMLNPQRPTSLVKVGSWGWESRKTSFGMSKTLVECIEDRIYTENGFEYGDLKGLRAAWKEIQEAIKNSVQSGFQSPLYENLVQKPRELKKIEIANQRQEVEDYAKKYLNDLVEVRDGYWQSKVKGLYFEVVCEGTKVKVYNYRSTSLIVPVNKVRYTVDFLKEVLEIGAN